MFKPNDAVLVYLIPPMDAAHTAWVLAVGSPDAPAFACSSREEATFVVQTMAALAAQQCKPVVVHERNETDQEWRIAAL